MYSSSVHNANTLGHTYSTYKESLLYYYTLIFASIICIQIIVNMAILEYIRDRFENHLIWTRDRIHPNDPNNNVCIPLL